MILIDTNALVVLIIGLMDTRLFKNHKRTSIYEEKDFYDLQAAIVSLDRLVVLPNIWTEVDNLLNGFSGNYKYSYIETIATAVKNTSEKYIESVKATNHIYFSELGITDSLILEYSKECQMLITSDSKLSDYARANGIKVYDMIKSRNERF